MARLKGFEPLTHCLEVTRTPAVISKNKELAADLFF
jgi:hypothetical protein